ncbi:MAG: carboxypeptidase-like regulatory domain-containing protein, partial [Cytophagales bacterium]
MSSSILAYCQTGTIKGQIIDQETRKPLASANVFINKSTIGNSTDSLGSFQLSGIARPSVQELIVSFVGYENKKMTLSVVSHELNLGIIYLTPSSQYLNPVSVSTQRDKEWEKNLRRFEKIFLGNERNAKQCKILNPWVLDFLV